MGESDQPRMTTQLRVYGTAVPVKLSYGACKKLVKFAATLFDAGYIVPGTGIDFYYFALFDE